MTGFYQPIIAEALPGLSDAQYEAIEDTMRHIIFHSTLDWQTRAQLKRGARQAYKVIQSRV